MMQENVLSHLTNNENSVTTLLKALCVLKPIRDVVIKIFTQNTFGADDVDFECISTQFNIGEAIPDICIQNDELLIAVEIKISDWRGLTANQPHKYLEWLSNNNIEKKFFVFLTTPRYSLEHRKEYDKRKQRFCASNPQHGINFIEIDWLELRSAFEETGLSSSCVYTRDFENLLKEWYMPSPIKFTKKELQVDSMFNKESADGISKIFEFIEEIASEFERAGFKVERSFKKDWWKNEHGIYLSQDDGEKKYPYSKCILWVGLWMPFWKAHGYPLCIGVHDGKWDSKFISDFKSVFPDCVVYKSFLTKGIEQHLLMENSVKDVSDWLLKKYLNKYLANTDDGQSELISTSIET
jgi:hypothetical protein